MLVFLKILLEFPFFSLIIQCMTAELISEINKRFKKAITKDPNVLTCIISGRSRPTNTLYLEEKAVKAGSKERFVKYYVCREALSMLRAGLSIEQIRSELCVDQSVPMPSSEDIIEALKTNGK